MLKLKIKQAVIQSFDRSNTDRVYVSPIGYNMIMKMEETSRNELIDYMKTFIDKASDPGQKKLLACISYLEKFPPSPHDGSYEIESWGDDNSLTGLLINGHKYPNFEGHTDRMLILSDIEVSMSVRVMEKKDKSLIPVFQVFLIDNIKLDNPKPKK